MVRFTIRKKILFGLIIGAALPIVLLEMINSRSARTELQMQQIAGLDAIADLKKQRVEEFFKTIAKDAELLSHLELITNPLPTITTHLQNRETEAYQTARINLDTHLIPIQEEKNFLEIILADKDGRMVYNTGKVHNDEELGMSVEMLINKDHFLKNGSRIFVSDVFASPFAPSGYELISAAPVYEHFNGHEHGSHGEYIGMVILAIDIGPVFDVILDTKGLGNTGETLLGRNEGSHALFINPLRHDKEAALKRKIPYTQDTTYALPVREATHGKNGNGITTDYRGEEVVASWRPLDLPSNNLAWGLVAKIDTVEAFAASNRLLRQAILIGIGAILLLILANSYLGRSIVRPLHQVRRAAKKIASGDLKARVNYRGNNEIGDVATSFNHMTDELVRTRSHLATQNNTLVLNVRELAQKNKEIEQSKKAMLNILEDVEAEKEKTIQEKERIATILESIGDGVFVVNTDHIIEIINPVAEALCGYTAEEALGKPYKDILHFVYEKNGKVNDQFIVDAIATGKIQEMNNHTVLIPRSGKNIPVADSAAPLKDIHGNILGCVVVFRDVSKEHAIDKAKSEFVSLASHQLRTPLAAINWNMEMLLDEAGPTLDKDMQQSLQDVYTSSKRMSELVNALLNVSRLELGTFVVDPEPTDVIAISKAVVKDLQPKIREKKLHIQENYTPEQIIMDVDPKLMRMVIENIISNAVKYTPTQKNIHIDIQKDSATLYIQIRDEGCGIPKNQQHKIFTRLFRADNVRTKDVDGTGLGLYIAKSIVEHSEGTIKFESKENKGTTFFVTLPLTGMTKREGKKNLT